MGQTFAFSDREEQLADLYGAIVRAGNTLVSGQRPTTARVAVSGYIGVGKSTLVLQALRILRGDAPLPARLVGLPDPTEPQKWLILRVSGKHVRGIQGLPDDLHRSILGVLSDAARSAEHGIPGVLKLPFFHRLFGRERDLYDRVRTSLTSLTLVIEFVRAYQGAKLTEKLEESRRADRSTEVKAFLETQVELKGYKISSAEAKAAVGLASTFIGKWSQTFEGKRTIEQEITVNADLATEALNAFFETTTAAGIPTILFLDDMDELASSAGVSQTERAKVLMEVLGVFNQLSPTCLVFALRKEYAHEDLLRQFVRVYLPPMTRHAGHEMLDAWVDIQTVQWSDEMRAEIRTLGERFLTPFPEDVPVVVPDSFLSLVTWAATQARPNESTRDLLSRYLRLRHDGETVRATSRVAMALSFEDAAACAETIPIDPARYSLSDNERHSLEKDGMLRPAIAWKSDDSRVILDPILAYLRHAT